jgi:hypothetical protein
MFISIQKNRNGAAWNFFISIPLQHCTRWWRVLLNLSAAICQNITSIVCCLHFLSRNQKTF